MVGRGYYRDLFDEIKFNEVKCSNGRVGADLQPRIPTAQAPRRANEGGYESEYRESMSQTIES